MKKIFGILLAAVMLFAFAACSSNSESEAPADDGQNPVMNFIGDYACDRCSIHVEAEGDEDAAVTIHWGSSAFDGSDWTMTGHFDPETLTVSYLDGVRVDRTYSEDGELQMETIVYENGTGYFQFNEDLTLTWTDGMEHMADDMVFSYVPVG